MACKPTKINRSFIKTVNPYDLNSLAEHDRRWRQTTWVDWNDKPNPYDAGARHDYDRRRHERDL